MVKVVTLILFQILLIIYLCCHRSIELDVKSLMSTFEPYLMTSGCFLPTTEQKILVFALNFNIKAYKEASPCEKRRSRDLSCVDLRSCHWIYGELDGRGPILSRCSGGRLFEKTAA